jgi:hypothetical protein
VRTESIYSLVLLSIRSAIDTFSNILLLSELTRTGIIKLVALLKIIPNTVSDVLLLSTQ